MKTDALSAFAAAAALALSVVLAAPAKAQSPEVKEKPPMYTYVANWSIPRAHWSELGKTDTATAKILGKALTDGTLVGYGSDRTLVHDAEGSTHDTWWSATSMAGLLTALDALDNSGSTTSAVLASSTRHSDVVYISRFYARKSGSWNNAYTHGSSYKLKADAPDNAVEMLSRNFIVPLLDKLLADGTIFEYEIDEQAIHTAAPGTFSVFYLTADAQGIDKVDAALEQSIGANPLAGQAIGSLVDFNEHRDYLGRTAATYK